MKLKILHIKIDTFFPFLKLRRIRQSKDWAQGLCNIKGVSSLFSITAYLTPQLASHAKKRLFLIFLYNSMLHLYRKTIKKGNPSLALAIPTTSAIWRLPQTTFDKLSHKHRPKGFNIRDLHITQLFFIPLRMLMISQDLNVEVHAIRWISQVKRRWFSSYRKYSVTITINSPDNWQNSQCFLPVHPAPLFSDFDWKRWRMTDNFLCRPLHYLSPDIEMPAEVWTTSIHTRVKVRTAGCKISFQYELETQGWNKTLGSFWVWK